MNEQQHTFVVRRDGNGGWIASVKDEVTCAWGLTPLAAMKALCDLLEKEWGAER